MMLFLRVLQLLPVLNVAVGSIISMPNCVDHCGDVQIPYPFGIGPNCYREPPYEIICNASFGSPKPFLREFNLEVLDINWPGRYSRQDPRETNSDDKGQIITVGMPRQNICTSDGTKEIRSYDFKGSPYFYSMDDNVLMMEGCGGSALLKNRDRKVLAGCASVCDSDAPNMSGTTCFGIGCCQASMPSYEGYVRGRGVDFYEINVGFEQPIKSNICNASVALIDSSSMENFNGSLSSLEIFPTTLYWMDSVGQLLPTENKENFSFIDQEFECHYPYEGNPFIPYGCQVVEECHKCKSRCELGRNPTGQGFYYCEKHLLLRRAPFLGFIAGLGFVLLVLGSYWLYRYVKWRREIRRKAEHFKRNGGLLLQQQMSSDEGAVETTKFFAVAELEKATDNFNDNRILGQGGQGTVYKGMLMDGKIVAIKKAKKVDESQVGQFVNEVVILSQINHRNVVKLLGCCLETEVPILVYEFVPNGTLYEHIHGRSEDFHVTWKMRLQIAAESAGAVAYLHSSSSAPIYHRDIKSTNILLDEKYRAKVSDFGTSKAINIDQTHVTTVILGTYGYLDPEYFQSNQFTEKSDVYSFGVVLVELITGKKPICPTGDGGWISLSTEFLTHMENSRLLDMLDARIIDEGKENEFMAVAELARKCLNMNGKLRPTMKEIAVQLDGIRSAEMPILTDLRREETNHAITEVIYSDGGPFGQGMFFADDDPPACSVEILPLMTCN
ncbi:hypothetical protein RND81_12G165100 [Saponaria officinalis]|uniref:Protein kinase domain-containing protein n=1 Tax=Saponaria officinalis TaxID=3572 RepID=A0AAW1HBE0_SAPOF